MKYLLILIIGCTTTADVERRIGEGASCESVRGENSYLCTTKSGKHYVCTVSSGDAIFCFEAVDARDLE